jgi:hypothetical protein
MNKESVFFIYLIEKYAESRNMTTNDVLEQWDELGITDHIYEMYEMYHSERLENAFDDIDRLSKEKTGPKC